MNLGKHDIEVSKHETGLKTFEYHEVGLGKKVDLKIIKLA